MNDLMVNSNQLEPIKDENPNREELDQDLKYSREKQLDLIETGHDSLQTLVEVAKQLQHPRAFEVLATYLKTMSELNKDLISISERKSYEETPAAPVQQTVNQMNFVGSTAELSALIKTLKEKKTIESE